MLCTRIVEKYKCSVIRRALFRVYTDAVREKQQALQLQEFAALLQLFDVIKYGTKIRIAVAADIKVLQHVIEMLRSVILVSDWMPASHCMICTLTVRKKLLPSNKIVTVSSKNFLTNSPLQEPEVSIAMTKS